MDDLSHLNHDVLVLNSDYAPLNVCNLKRAIALVYLGKVDVLHTEEKMVQTLMGYFDSPSVVRLKQQVKRPIPELRLSRRSIFARDNYTCQYCGYTGKELTVDHVVPKRLGGPTSWDNLVCCCRKCNGKKGDKTLQQIGYLLPRPPRRPKYVPFVSLIKFVRGTKNKAWRDYLPIFDDVDAAAATHEH